MTPEDTEDAFAFTTFMPAATGTVERSGQWVSTEDGSPLYIEDGVAKTGPKGKVIDDGKDGPKPEGAATEKTSTAKAVKSSDVGELPQPKKMRANADAVEGAATDIFRHANSGKTPDQIADELFNSGEAFDMLNEGDLSSYQTATEKHFDKTAGDAETVDGQDWEDWLSDRTLNNAKAAGKPAVVAEITKVLNRPIDGDTRDAIGDYLDNFGKAPVSHTQHVEKIMQRWPVKKEDAEALVAAKLGKK